MKQRTPRVIKKESWTFANKDCLNCVNRNICIRCSSLNLPLRKIFLYTLGYKEKDNKNMKLGKKIHSEYFKDIKEIEEYGLKEFYSDLYKGKEIKITEIPVCSKKYALRGHLDCLTIQFDGNAYNIEITELKAKYNKSHFFQVWAYALILSDPNCNIMYKVKKRKEYLLTKRLYPPNRPIVINLRIRFIYYKTKKIYSSEWINNNTIGSFVSPVMTKAKRIRKFMNAGEFYLSNLKECPFCKRVKCDFIDICQRFPYKKGIQTKFGKRKIVIPSKL